MTAGLINIVSYGAQDLYLTGTPQISYFNTVYRRYTNFSQESIEISFDTEVGFGSISRKILPLIGDLVHKSYLKIYLPAISFPRILSSTAITNANNAYNVALNNYKTFTVFMGVNGNAYRAALDVYSAANIVYSTEMVNNINAVFSSYSSDTFTQDAVTYYQTNTPISYLTPNVFNIQQIATAVSSPSTYLKDTLKYTLDNALKYCIQIQQLYENTLNTAYNTLVDAMNKNFKFAWVDKLGHAIIDYIEVIIGGERIDKHYGDWLNIWYELSGEKDLDTTYMKMIGNVTDLTTFDRTIKPAYELCIPLQFWFSRFNGLALPLIALQYHDVEIAVKLKKFKQVAYIEDMRNYDDANYKTSINLDDLFNNNNYSLSASLLIDYIYLDSLERKKFAQSSHEYLIDQVQIDKITGINYANIQNVLNFANPCKNIIWIAQKDAYVDNTNGFTKCRWDNYSLLKNKKGNPTLSATLDLQGHRRFDFSGAYFNNLQPYIGNKNSPCDGINCYNFALECDQYQPSGTCNFSRIPKALFNLYLDNSIFNYYATDYIDELVPDNNTPILNTLVTVKLYALNSNALRFISGMAGVAFV